MANFNNFFPVNKPVGSGNPEALYAFKEGWCPIFFARKARGMLSLEANVRNERSAKSFSRLDTDRLPSYGCCIHRRFGRVGKPAGRRVTSRTAPGARGGPRSRYSC